MIAKFLEFKNNLLKDLKPIKDNLLFSPSEIYHENSKLYPSNIEWLSNVSKINSSKISSHIISKPFKRYHGYPTVRLPKSNKYSNFKFEEVISRRQSDYNLSGKPIHLENLSTILYIGNGISKFQAGYTRRTTPSAGALYPIELYCISIKVNELQPGIYFYSVIEHSLKQLNKGNFFNKLVEIMPGSKKIIGNSGVCLVLSAVMPRIKFKYGERGYRFALLECGHIAQNLLLATKAYGLGAVPVGGFFDDKFHDLLELDGIEEIITYCIFIGNKDT